MRRSDQRQRPGTDVKGAPRRARSTAHSTSRSTTRATTRAKTRATKRATTRAATRSHASIASASSKRRAATSGRTTSFYRGRALANDSPRRIRRPPVWVSLGVLVGIVVIGIVVSGVGGRAWSKISGAVAGLQLGQAQVMVHGNQYLATAEILETAGLNEKASFFDADLDGSRQKLLDHPRIRKARVERRFRGHIQIEIVERVPAALVSREKLFEVDRDGYLLPSLLRGSLADLPVVRGLERPRKGRIEDPDYRRALRWLDALELPQVGLVDRVSEIDVLLANETKIVLSPEGTTVLLPRDPEQMESLSALRVVLADLEAQGTRAVRIDCRARGMAVVKPVPGTTAAKRLSPERGKRTNPDPGTTTL